MPIEALKVSLKKLNLSDKEAAVYVALLSLGSTTVLQVSRKAKVARATTYLVLENLIKMGLVTYYESNGTSQYVAEDPEVLKTLIEQKRNQLTQEEQLLEDAIPRLRAFMWTEDQRPIVRYYQDIEGLKTLRSDMLRYSKPGGTWYNITPMDHLLDTFGENSYLYDRQRLVLNIKSKTLFTTKSKAVKEAVLAGADGRRVQRRFVPPGKFIGSTGITIFGDRVAMGIMSEKKGGILIESKSVAATLKDVFELAWSASKD